MRIAVIGDSDVFTGFGLVGIKDIYDLKMDKREVEGTFKMLIENRDIGIIVISNNYANLIRDLICKVNKTKKITPVIVEIPDKSGEMKIDPFEDLIKKVIGVKL
ncbi:MAG: V-type ATP synthase subunit F [Candidatus Methanofastidiosia archaeon]